MNKLSCIGLIGLYILTFSGVLFAAEGVDPPRYMAIFLDGKKVGHSISTRTEAGNRVISTEEMSFTIYRGVQAITMETRETSIETADGRPLGFEMTQNASGTEKTYSGIIGPDGMMEVTISEAIGQPQTFKLPYPRGALMAEGLKLLQDEKGLTTGSEFELVVFRPDMIESTGGAISMIVKGGPKKEIQLLDKKVEALETTTTMQVPIPFQEKPVSITTTNYCDENLEPLKILLTFMDMTLEIVACDEELAMRPVDIFDFLAKMTVACPVPLPPLDTVESITYELVVLTSAGLEIPADDSQSLQNPAENRILLTVHPVSAPAGAAFPYTGKDPEILEALKPTEYLQCQDPKIVDMARHAIAGTDDALKAIRQIESFVNGYIQHRDFSVGYASAREVAESRRGDCSEHAVLTAALCRAIGIPARVVSGLVYTESLAEQKNVFGGHAWTEVYIGGVWVGLDATPKSTSDTPSPRGYTPGHIALARGNGNPTDFINLVKVLGAFRIDKVTVQTKSSTGVEKKNIPGKESAS